MSEKCSESNKKLCKRTKNVLLWHIMVLNCRDCLVWPCIALHGLMWPLKYGIDVAFHGHDYVWPH